MEENLTTKIEKTGALLNELSEFEREVRRIAAECEPEASELPAAGLPAAIRRHIGVNLREAVTGHIRIDTNERQYLIPVVAEEVTTEEYPAPAASSGGIELWGEWDDEKG